MRKMMIKSLDFVRQNIWRFSIQMLLAIVFVVALPSTYAADNANTVTMESIDAAAKGDKGLSLDTVTGMNLIRRIFGPIADDPLSKGGAEKTSLVLGDVFGIINMSLLALGTMLLTYNITSGIAQTANDGEFLGKRFSTLWIPVRWSTAVVALVPAAGGWSLAQLVIIWFSVMGVGIANLGTNEIAKHLSDGASSLVYRTPEARGVPKNVGVFVDSVLEMNLCMVATNLEAENKVGVRNIDNFGADKWVSYGSGRCGSVVIPKLMLVPEVPDSLESLKAVSISTSSKVEEAFKSLDIELNAIAHDIVDRIQKADHEIVVSTPFDKEKYNKAQQAYVAALMKSSVRPSVKDNQARAANRLREQGFVVLGSYYSSIAQDSFNRDAMDQLAPRVRDSAPTPEDIDSSYREYYSRALAYFQGNKEIAPEAKRKPSADANFILSIVMDSAGTDCTIWGGLSSIIGNTQCGSQQDSMLLRTQEIGQTIMNSTVLATTAVVLAVGVIKGTDSSIYGRVAKAFAGPITGAVKETAYFFANVVLSALGIMFFFAVMLAYYLPLLPYIAWLGAIISWVAVMFEGVVAAPIWAFAHMDSDGDGMGQRTQHGYIFILQVLLRPILMVVGFLCAVIMMDVMGWFFYATYPLALSDAGSIGGFGDLFGMVVSIGVFFTASVMVVNLSINLIHLIPDAAMEWIGGRTGTAGTGSGAGGNFAQGSVAATAAGRNIMQSAYGSLQQKKSRDNQAAGRGKNDADQENGVKMLAKKTA